MAKAILIQNMDDKCNEAINKKRAQLLLEGKDFKKSEVVVEILHEWLECKILYRLHFMEIVFFNPDPSWPNDAPGSNQIFYY